MAWLVGRALPWLAGLALLPLWFAAAEESDDEEEPHLCPKLDDENGRWEGSREVGGNYTLRCAPGFQVTRRTGYSSGTIVCPANLRWPEDLRCEDVDNCDQLEHGCGAKGICVDLVNGYDCNCEKGYPRRKAENGEIVCGQEEDMDICGGITCGSYGLCIDLDPDHVAAVHTRGKKTRRFRCECADGFFDNGTSCVRRDCGVMHDELGTWTGSTLFNQEYTLECPAHSFVWGQRGLVDVTVHCSRRGTWLSHPICHSPALEAQDARMEVLRFWVSLACVLTCICSAALAAGLTLGLATLEPFGLAVMMATQEEHCKGKEAKEKLRRDQVNSQLILPLVRDHHRLLVTLMLFNTVANESLPIFLDELVPSWAAVLVSVTAVLICGEILPSAIFTGPSRMEIAGACVPLVRFLQWIFHFISTPIIKILDHLIGHEDAEGSIKYSRAELRALLQLHGQKSDEDGGHVQKVATGEENSQISNSGSGAFSCLLGQSGTEKAADHAHGEEGGHAVLSASELLQVNGALELQDIPLDVVPYTKRRQCAIAGMEDVAADVLKNQVLGLGNRAVLVLRSDSFHVEQGTQRPLARSSTSSLRWPLVTASEVCGCLRARDVVHGGQSTLARLCDDPVVAIPGSATALEALRYLKGSGSFLGLVVHGPEGSGNVLGVVSRSEILSVLLTQRLRVSHAVPAETAGGQDANRPGAVVPPTPTRRHVGHRPLLSRSHSLMERSFERTSSHNSTPLHRPSGPSAATSFEGYGLDTLGVARSSS